MKKELALTFLVSLVIGSLVWALSPVISGVSEPWDSETLYYPVALAVGGLIAGLIRPKYFWLHYFGIFFGQLAFMLIFLPMGPLIVVGITVLASQSLIALLTAAGGAGIRRLAR